MKPQIENIETTKKNSSINISYCYFYADVGFYDSEYFSPIHCKRFERVTTQYAKCYYQLCFDISFIYAC